MSVPIEKTFGDERGSAILTVAVIGILMGVIISFGIGSLKTEDPIDRRLETLRKMEYVIDQLADFTQYNGRVPCPADPGVAKTSRLFGVERLASGYCTTANQVGIVPFRALNIDEDDARDAWGRYFTYAVSPAVANQPNPFTNAVEMGKFDAQIFYRCRDAEWIKGGVNGNPRKARFCCPGPNITLAPQIQTTHDILIKTTSGVGNEIKADPRATLDLANDNKTRDPQLLHKHAGINIIPTAPNLATFPASTSTASLFAFTLVSHGMNGFGAFDGTSSTSQLNWNGGSNNEDENADRDREFVDRPLIIEEGANYFDDIVMYRTQTELYAELNNGSCLRPWR